MTPRCKHFLVPIGCAEPGSQAAVRRQPCSRPPTDMWAVFDRLPPPILADQPMSYFTPNCGAWVLEGMAGGMPALAALCRGRQGGWILWPRSAGGQGAGERGGGGLPCPAAGPARWLQAVPWLLQVDSRRPGARRALQRPSRRDELWIEVTAGASSASQCEQRRPGSRPTPAPPSAVLSTLVARGGAVMAAGAAHTPPSSSSETAPTRLLSGLRAHGRLRL